MFQRADQEDCNGQKWVLDSVFPNMQNIWSYPISVNISVQKPLYKWMGVGGKYRIILNI